MSFMHDKRFINSAMDAETHVTVPAADGVIARDGRLFATVKPYEIAGHGVFADTYRWAVYYETDQGGPALYADGLKHRKGDPDLAQIEAVTAGTDVFNMWVARITVAG